MNKKVEMLLQKEQKQDKFPAPVNGSNDGLMAGGTSDGSRIDCRGGLSIPRALARAKFYVLRPLLDRLRMTYVLPVRPTSRPELIIHLK